MKFLIRASNKALEKRQTSKPRNKPELTFILWMAYFFRNEPHLTHSLNINSVSFFFMIGHETDPHYIKYNQGYTVYYMFVRNNS